MLIALRTLIRAYLTRLKIRHLEKRKLTLDPQRKKNFVFWVPGGMPLMLDVEGAIAQSLTLRGHKVHAVICDGVAKACVKREASINPDMETWSRECVACKKSCQAKLRDFNVEHSFIGDHVDAEKLVELRAVAATVTWEDLPDFEYQGIKIGKNIQSSVLRYLKGASYSGDQALLREYVLSGLVTLAAARNAFEKIEPTNIFMSHGIYVDWGPALRVALEQGVRATCWGASYLPARFYFRHPTDYRIDLDFHKLEESTWARESKALLSEEETRQLQHYLDNRYVKGKSFDLKRSKSYRGETKSIRANYGFGMHRKIWGVMAHVNWDAVTDYSPMLFEDFEKWIISTIERIQNVRSVDWLIKIHPAEAWDNPSTGIQALIARRFGRLPDHIRVVGYDDNINPLDFYNLIDGAVTVYGTAGLEISCLGKPVILAGDAHYSRKGFTYDPKSIDEYHGFLDTVDSLGPLTRAQQQLALRYAYIYFIQRQIPFPPVENLDADEELGFWRFEPSAADALAPNGNKYVEFLVQRIIDDGEFILPKELLESR